MTQEAIKHFLYETFGYRKIDELIQGKKGPKTSIRTWLDGTLLGTFGRRSSPVMDVSVDGGSAPAWNNHYIKVPHIYPVSELESEIERGKRYLNSSCGRSIKPEIQQRAFFLSSYTAFVGNTAREVGEKIKTIHQEEFPQAKYSFGIMGRFSGHIKSDDFYLFTEGSTSRTGAKLIVASFNLPVEVAEDLNRISAHYQRMMTRLHRESPTPSVESE